MYWFFILRFEEYTDDAYVHGNIMEINPQITGVISSINVEETDYVEKGQIIIKVDDTQYSLALEKQKEILAHTIRSTAALFEEVKELEANIHKLEANLIKTEQDYNHRDALVDVGGVSIEEYEHSKAYLMEAKASLEMAFHEYYAKYALIQNTEVRTNPKVLAAIDALKSAYMNVIRCNVRAPVCGYIAKRRAQVGEVAEPNIALLALIPLHEIWVEANFKEVQLKSMRIGQEVMLSSDIYKGLVEYRGKVIGIGAGTGSAFSVLPPQNATGNWIKIVQRVPVRISIEKEQIESFPLRIGLSMEATVNIKDVSGKMLATPQKLKPLYYTDIYQEQLDGVDTLIEEIFTQNLFDCEITHGT